MSPEEARRRAIIDFGGREQVRQQVREVHLFALAESLRFHLRASLRFLLKSPGFSLAVILTLALGIGADTAVFSAIDAIVLRPLPFPHGSQLVRIYQHDAKSRNANTSVSPQRLEDWNRMSTALSGVTGYYKDDLSELSGPLPERVTKALVSPHFLQVLGVAPMLGRNFTAEEEHFGGPNAVLISYSYWQQKFQGDLEVLNKKLHIGQYFDSVVSVMPRSFDYADRDVEIWAPSPPDAPYAQRRDEMWFSVLGRMKPGITVQRAAADLSTVQARLGRQFPKPDAELTVETVSLKSTIVGDSAHSLWLLYGSVWLLLLIACSNIAALLLARTAEREHEISVRYSLGASRRTIVLQLLSEVLGLAFLGALLLLVASLASLATALRAAFLEPVTVLREQ